MSAPQHPPQLMADVTAVAATISATLAPRLKSQTGRANPCKKGPKACAPASSWHSLYAMLPASRSGKISTLAAPAPSPFFAAIAAFSAASACTGPNTPARSAARRTRSTLSPAPLVPVEKDSMASSDRPKSAPAEAAEARAISASSSAEGATFTAQSAKIISRPSAKSITKKDEAVLTPAAGPIAIDAASITRRVGLSAPATMASASPAATMAAARYKGLANKRRAIASFRPRWATSAATCAALTSARGTGSHSPRALSCTMASATRASPASGKTIRRGRACAAAYIFSKNFMYASVYRNQRSQL